MTSGGDEMEPFFRGERLWGDDFSADEIEAWFEDEREAYAALDDENSVDYGYHALNTTHCYDLLSAGPIQHVLGLGSATGDEFLPIKDRIQRLTIVEPSSTFIRDSVHGIPARFVTPAASGLLPFESDEFDLVTSFGVLHHIPNVRFVISELFRCQQPGGLLFLREPIISMGDWRKPRPNLTKRERGIPLPILRDALRCSGYVIRRERLVAFSPLTRLCSLARIHNPFNRRSIVVIDQTLSRLFTCNLRYHARSPLDKLRPTSAVFVAQKS
jgi:SAM-dependent methyltransferase